MTDHGVNKGLVNAALLIAAIVVAWGFLLIGGPSFNRKVSMDRIRLEDLSRLKEEVEQYFHNQQKLPEKLADLEQVLGWHRSQRNLEDPSTKKPYEYRILEVNSYELCADFELSSKDAELEQSRYIFDVRSADHDAGHHCFKFTIPQK